MIYIGENEIAGIYLGDTEIQGIYCGDTQIYPMNFGTLTGITIDNLTWVTDVSANGGTATSANCSFIVTAHYDSGKSKRVTSHSTVSGSLVVSATTADTREAVGTLELTATYSGVSTTSGVTAYQKAQTYNNRLLYTTTDGNQLSRDFSTYAWAQNYISHTFSNGVGHILFDDDLTTIASSAFSGCDTLATITIPITVTSYGTEAFKNCSGMTEFLISSAITSIGSECFYETTGVLTIESAYAASGSPRNVDSYTYGFAYKFCGSWKSGDGGGGPQSPTFMNFSKVIITGNTITSIQSSAFHCSPATEYVIGDNITSIGYMSFARMDGGGYDIAQQSVLNHKPLLTLTVGSGLTNAQSFWLFYGPASLTRINYYPPTYSAPGNSAWYGSQRTASVHYKEGSTGRMQNLPSWFTVYYDL